MHGRSSSSATSSVGDSHAQSISPEILPPVWETKPETDACYNACASVLVDELASIVHSRFSTSSSSPVGVLFGTHNAVSCNHILKSLVRSGLAKEEEEIVEATTKEGKDNNSVRVSKKVVRLSNEVGERVTFGQLYGMHDELAEKLLECTRADAPVLIK
jgi:proline dehydrogenase